MRIASLSDLDSMERRETFRLLSSAGRVEVALPGLRADEASRWAHRIQRHLSDCGCGAGGLVAVVGFVVVLVLGGTLVRAGAAALAGAIVGKVAGLLVARVRFRRSVRALRALVRTRLEAQTMMTGLAPRQVAGKCSMM